MQTKQEPTQYDECGETILDLAKMLIGKYHSHLATKKMKFLYINKPITRKGRTVAATAEKISDKIRAISDDIDFLITISYPIFNDLSDELKQYVLDHELCHCWVDESDSGDEKNVILPHDFEDFNEVVSRYGALTLEIQKLREVLKKVNNKNKDNEDAKE